MTNILICLLTLLFSMSSPATERNADFWQSPLAADTGISVASSGAGNILPATLVRQIQQGEKVSSLIDEVAQLTYESGGQEHAIVSLQSGDRVIVSGGTGGIDFGGMDDLNRIILHTHPTTTGPSAIDFQMLQQTGQQSSWIYELFGGGLTKFHQ